MYTLGGIKGKFAGLLGIAILSVDLGKNYPLQSAKGVVICKILLLLSCVLCNKH